MIEGEDESDWVIGDLYEMADPEKLLAELDRYEGCMPDEPQPYVFRRELTDVVVDHRESAKAWVYYYVGKMDEKQRVASGDYREVIANR